MVLLALNCKSCKLCLLREVSSSPKVFPGYVGLFTIAGSHIHASSSALLPGEALSLLTTLELLLTPLVRRPL